MRNTNDLRIRYDFGSEGLVIQRVGKFLGQTVPLIVGLSRDSKEIVDAHVSGLSTFLPKPDEFEPTPEVHARVGTGTARIASGVIAGAKLTGGGPQYPMSARAAHISGTVTLRAIIGRDGHIHSLKVMSTPDPDLALSAIAAVRQWTYKPYLLNGEATEVDTTIVVNFNLN